jgi:uncharacterized protein (DUF2336 family)
MECGISCNMNGYMHNVILDCIKILSLQHSLSISKLCNNHQIHPEAFVVPLEILPSKRCHQHIKGSKVLGRYQSCLQYPEKYCLDPLSG